MAKSLWKERKLSSERFPPWGHEAEPFHDRSSLLPVYELYEPPRQSLLFRGAHNGHGLVYGVMESRVYGRVGHLGHLGHGKGHYPCRGVSRLDELQRLPHVLAVYELVLNAIPYPRALEGLHGRRTIRSEHTHRITHTFSFTW